MAQQRDYTKGSILGNIIVLSLPMVIGNILQNAFNIVDMIFVGRLGPSAIAAVSISGTILNIVWTLFIGIAMGTSAMIARFYGAGKSGETGRVAFQSLLMGLIISLILAIIGNFFSGWFIRSLGAAPDVVELGDTYLRIVFSGSFTLIFLFLISSMFRGSGDSFTPMIVTGVATILNIILDPLLIFGIWIFPQWGVKGAAVATVLGQGVGMIVNLFILFRGGSRVRVHLHQLEINTDLMKRIIRIALPGSTQVALRSIAAIVLMKIVALYGTVVIAAYGIGIRLAIMVMMPGWAIGAAAATILGQNLGANQPERAERNTWVATSIYVLITFIIALVFFIFADGVIKIFNSDDGVVNAGTSYLRIVSPFYIFLAVSLTTGMSLNGAGDTFSPMVIIAITSIGIQIPLALILPKVSNLYINGLWLSMGITLLLQAIFMAYWFRKGKWKKRII
ncbi:MAG: MATE family efflux transporter [Fidelibacterota bacterium]